MVQHSVRRFVFLLFDSSRSSMSSFSSFPLAPSPLSSSPAPLFPSHDLIVSLSLSISRSPDLLSLLVFVVHTLPTESRAKEEQWEDYNDYIDLRY